MTDFDDYFNGFYQWLAGQYDTEYGGFYYAKSSMKDERFQPDIESTAQAISILHRSDLIGALPNFMRAHIICFFQERQNSHGYFLDPHNDMRSVDRMVARALNYSTKSLQILGTRPVYPLPGQLSMTQLPPHLRSLKALESWLHQRPWENAWMACDNISAASVYLLAMPEKQRNTYLRYIWDFLEKNQNSTTGMWGKGRPYIRLSGTFKLALFYFKCNKDMPRAQNIFEFAKYCLNNDVSEDICWTRNVMDLLTIIRYQLPKISRNEREKIVAATWANLMKYRKSDGGYSRHKKHSLEMPNNVILGHGLAEGDMNASTQALLVRSLSLQFLDQQDRPLKNSKKDFFQNLKSYLP